MTVYATLMVTLEHLLLDEEMIRSSMFHLFRYNKAIYPIRVALSFCDLCDTFFSVTHTNYGIEGKNKQIHLMCYVE